MTVSSIYAPSSAKKNLVKKIKNLRSVEPKKLVRSLWEFQWRSKRLKSGQRDVYYFSAPVSGQGRPPLVSGQFMARSQITCGTMKKCPFQIFQTRFASIDVSRLFRSHLSLTPL